MRSIALALTAGALGRTWAAPFDLQRPLQPAGQGATTAVAQSQKPLPLHGRFLHITDLHPDPFYERDSSTDDDHVCHRGSGDAGHYGAALSDCDSPFALINATFAWIDANLKDEIDFVIWTGDSARHDNDEEHPRDNEQVAGLNTFVVDKFREVFGTGRKGDDTFTVPIIPTFGNNDILPHNVFFAGPNYWTHRYLDLWRPFIPEAQRHSFDTGGWFFNEVIPNELAVFSLNSLYFFDHNSAVDGCANRDEPGYAQFDWLRVQLQFLRRRGMKAILIGHVPPARTANKMSWDESCWQKFTLWLRQYRDVVVGSMWGHMNIDHFMLQDAAELDFTLMDEGLAAKEPRLKVVGDDEMTIQGSTEYLSDLLQQFKELPEHPKAAFPHGTNKYREQYHASIGGEWAERYSGSFVSASVVPNYFPSLRIVSYNISDLDRSRHVPGKHTNKPAEFGSEDDIAADEEDLEPFILDTEVAKRPDFKVPKPPSNSSPPGPAYSPQSLTLLSWRQLFANITAINAAFASATTEKEKDKVFKFELEYDTAEDRIYKLKDLTIKSLLKLAQKLGKYKPVDEDILPPDGDETGVASEAKEEIEEKTMGKKKGKKEKRQKRNRPWRTFLQRAFVGAKDVEDVLKKMRNYWPASQIETSTEL